MRGNKLFKKLDALAGKAGIVALAPFSSGRAEPPREPRRVLVVKLAALGDTLLMVPALREIRRRWPGARIGMVGTAVNRDVAAELPAWVDEFFCLEPGRAVRDPRYFARFVAGLRREGWEVGIDFDQWTHVTPLLLRLAGVPVRVGFRTAEPVRHRLYTHTRPRLAESHEAENFLRLLEPLGFAPPAPVLELPVRPEARERAGWALRAGGWDGVAPLVVVHAGCGGHGGLRAWPEARYRELCGRMAADDGSPFFVFTGAGETERALATSLAAAFPGRALAATDAALPDFVATLSLAGVVVSGNTGAMHVAAALGVPQVALHGPTDAAKWGPLNPRAVVVRSSCPGCPSLDMGWEYHRTDGFCMEQVAVDEVLDAVRRATGTPAGGALVPCTRNALD